MLDSTRRRALLAVASGIATLSGCLGENDRPMIDRRGDERVIEDYEIRKVRNEDGAVLFTQAEALPTATDEDDDQHRNVRSDWSVLVSEEGLIDLTFNDVPEARELRSFTAATEFDSASICLVSMPVEACYEIRLQSITIERDEIENDDLHPHTDFCRTYRPADVECGLEERHTVGFAIRVPVAAERSTGSGRGLSSSCRRSPRDESFDPRPNRTSGGGTE